MVSIYLLEPILSSNQMYFLILIDSFERRVLKAPSLSRNAPNNLISLNFWYKQAICVKSAKLALKTQRKCSMVE